MAMGKLPSGWIARPYYKDPLTIGLDMKELVTCRECKHRPIREKKAVCDHISGFDLVFPDTICPCQCIDGYYSWYPSDEWYCADGEKVGEAND